MRRTLILSATAAAAVVGVGVGFVASAAQAIGGTVATPSTTTVALPALPGLDELGITPEQTECLLGSASSIDLSDATSMLEIFGECGIDLMGIAVGAEDTAPDPVVETVVVADTSLPDAPSGGDLDPAAVTAVLAALGVDTLDLQCIDEGLSTAGPADDEGALEVLRGCGLSLADLLAAMVGLDDADGATDGSTTPSNTASAVDTGSASEIVDQIQQMLAGQGIELTDEQVTCLVDNLGDLDLGDIDATLAVFETCGISLTDLVG